MISCREHLRPTTLDEALSILSARAGEVTILAGGTDVIAGMQQGDTRFCHAHTLLDIGGISELRSIDERGFIGAGATFGDVARNEWLNNNYPLLCAAASSVGSVQIRNRATLVGNFVNNAACADSVPPLLVYDAQVSVRSQSARRIIPLADFLLAPNRTALKQSELVAGIHLPPPPSMPGRFYKLGRRRGIAISRITLAVLLKIDTDSIAELRVASGALNPIGTRFYEVEKLAKGMCASDPSWKILAQKLGESVLQKTGLRWSSEYKLPVVQQLIYGLLVELGKEERA